ncbi:hypothetical protein A2870_02895 [Candidatus Curtissbacteria bacterium RIFCSPHIGHO2_01_FULL_41_11]|uniref:Glycosyltransferase RgtA/B/C/D-like domain-containing protein n=1 Tax=Candidatus Curtissbacteria bacterium RIFCSPHIGHO2_01_FULL_41_11 TaxID=1797711 RepID=A0A1F5G6V5_9BACT|nr:MAG: hypothetical protein A2870_02895 [Candidatus Curtissbacteria bacterium RIFCSPHIGHO2_01_FULL_41_11]
MIVNLFLFWRIGLFLIGFLGATVFPKVENGALGSEANGQFDYWLSWAQWDGGHYFDIATRGYLIDTDYAFFPLFPVLIKFTNNLTGGNTITSGLLISNLALLTFLFVLKKYAERISSKREAQNIITTFLVFPTTFFAAAFYSESLFLLFVVATFLFLNERKYLPAAILAALAGITRLVGIFLVLSLAYSYFATIKFQISKVNRKILHLTVALFGFSSYAIYLWYKLNDPIRFLTVQSIWNRIVTDPISTIFSYLWRYITRQTIPINDFFDLATTLVFLIILILGRKKISSSLWIFSVLVILIPASTGTLTSMPRYALSSLGAFVILGKFLEEKPWLKIPLWSVSLSTQAYLLVRFITGYWVA